MKTSFLAMIIGSALLAAPAIANDSTAETAAGGLVLRHSDAIDMLSEDLYISAEQVRVSYVFRNQSGADVTTIVAFPLPPRDLELEAEMDVAYPREFRTSVAGQPVEMAVDRRAMLGEQDVTQRLSDLGLPLAPGDDWQEFHAAIDALDVAAADRLAEDGLLHIDSYEVNGQTQRYVRPLWQARETYYWEQTFPAGEDLAIAHSYRPGTGGSAGTALAYAPFRDSEEGQRMIADYCMDSSFLAGLDRLAAEGGDYPMLIEHRIGYILTTGANWRSPIGDFRLVIDKGDPRNIVSFCESGVRKIAPTQFEVRHQNWRPERDLRILIIEPYSDE